MSKKNIVVFTGAGISKESGIQTFRDTDDGLWLNHKIEDVASKTGFLKNMDLVLQFHNKIRSSLTGTEPNIAHTLLKDLEEHYNVILVTQNIDDLHEKASSSTIYHLHGELLKSRSMKDETIYDCFGDINIGDLCPNGGQLRPHTVLFEEMPYNVQEAYDALQEADILIIIGTSFNIGYTIQLVGSSTAREVYYIDPKPSKVLDRSFAKINYMKKTASQGMKILYKKLVK